MEHTPILPLETRSKPLAPALAQPAILDTLALHGLRELCFAPIPKVARALAGFDREQLGIAIEIMVAMLDAADGDPDDKQTNDAEDDFAFSEIALRSADRGPGCNASDSPGDQAYVEWHSMRGSQRRGPNILAGHEDAEEDDEPGQCDEDEANTNLCELVGYGPGCTISDAAEEDDDAGQASEDEISYGRPTFGRSGAGCELSDGAEEDDPSGQCTEDEISCGGQTSYWRSAGPGCELSDPGGRGEEAL